MKKIFRIKSNLKEIGSLVKKILDHLRGLNKEILDDIKLVTEEALINAMKHGNKFREDLPIIVNFSWAKDKISISVEDEGEGYDYTKIPDPTLDENIDKTSGRGVFLIKKLMDEVRFNPRGNRIEMVKYIK